MVTYLITAFPQGFVKKQKESDHSEKFTGMQQTLWIFAHSGIMKKVCSKERDDLVQGCRNKEFGCGQLNANWGLPVVQLFRVANFEAFIP